MENLTLYYFPMRARAEAIRMMLSIAGVQYKDVRIPGSEWPTKKADMMYGTMPVLDVNGVKIGQSVSITRYIAKHTDLGGKTALEDAQLDAAFHVITEVHDKQMSSNFEKDAEVIEKIQIAAAEKTRILFGLLEKQAHKDGPFFGGESMTYPDIKLYAVVEDHPEDMLKDCPKLQRIFENVGKNPKLIQHIKERPKTPF